VNRGDETLVEVALPVPIDGTLTYALPAGVTVEPGTRVLVPFRKTRKVGWVVSRTSGEPPEGVRRVEEILDESPSVPPELLRLCSWMSEYYVAPLGVALRAALPAFLSSASRPRVRPLTLRTLRIERWLEDLVEEEEVFGRSKRQREAYGVLRASGGRLALKDMLGHGFSRGVLTGLEGKGLVSITDEEIIRDPFASIDATTEPVHTPTPRQAEAVDHLAGALSGGSGGTFLLHGVTGSGKTLVYLELIRQALEQGRTAIVLVPEIALTPQTVRRFRSRFGDEIAVLHSGLSDGERYDAWRELRAGRRSVAVGARSALFAPLRDVGVIIVDEEHDGSYKQSESPRYQARDLAVVRARMEGAVCVLGSATPALESWMNVRKGKFGLIELPERVGGGALPPIRLVDLRDARKRAREGRKGSFSEGGLVLSPELVEAVSRRLGKGEQTILLLNRRGYSAFLQCRECGHVESCPNCAVSLTFHRSSGRLVCHHCRHEATAPHTCPRCGAVDWSYRGLGTEQVERVVGETFPGARLARMDVDTTSGKWAHHEILGRVGRGEVDILLGTQMIAKGLDFANVTLVGVVNADVGIHLPDFRATERTFQLLSQVAGRAGRGPKGGEVLIQTSLPDHYAVTAAVEHDYPGFARRELRERESPGYPPHVRLVNVVISSPDRQLAADAAEKAFGWLTKKDLGVDLVGPAPSPIERLHKRWRWHFLLRSPSASKLGEAAWALQRGVRLPGGDVRLAIDRDPSALL
jgi:primosomal protein N' (replication factor Y)